MKAHAIGPTAIAPPPAVSLEIHIDEFSLIEKTPAASEI